MPCIHKFSNDDIEYLRLTLKPPPHGFTMLIGGRAPSVECDNAIKFVRAARAAELKTVTFDHFEETIEQVVIFNGRDASWRAEGNVKTEFTEFT